MCIRDSGPLVDIAAVERRGGSPADGPHEAAARVPALEQRDLLAAGGEKVPLLEGWYASRGFVRAISRRAAAALDGCDVNEWAVLFTAHNVPLETIMEGDPYVEQLQQTISQLVPALALEGEAPVAG